MADTGEGDTGFLVPESAICEGRYYAGYARRRGVAAVSSRRIDGCRLVSLGVDWRRKCGDILRGISASRHLWLRRTLPG
jgi:hypothetical protein